ncbi:MAG: hypothetical protein ACLPKI_13555 [Streptosporangiaceae bacterium]
MPSGERGLTVAVTGPTGTFGFGLMPRRPADGRVARVVGVARGTGPASLFTAAVQ